jgi:hypothetical protein
MGGALRRKCPAIDILLLPGAEMLAHAAANNARLLGVYPKGFALDAAHHPHIASSATSRP